MFDTAFVLGGGSRGGTRGALLFYVLNLWNEGFRNGRFGYASALAWVLVVAAAVVIVLIFKTSSRWVYYESERQLTCATAVDPIGPAAPTMHARNPGACSDTRSIWC